MLKSMRETSAPQLKLDLGVALAGACTGQQASLQGGLIHGCNRRPVQSGSNRQAHVLGDNTFGDAQGRSEQLTVK